MAEKATLHSRLRVLVARTFKAEKLYASMQRKSSPSFPGPAALSELANDIRAKEWQRIHAELRGAINDILENCPVGQVGTKVNQLKDEFLLLAKNSSQDFSENLESLLEAAKKEEFTRTAKKSMELVRFKARLQAAQAVSEELTGILNLCGKSREGEVPEETISELHLLGDTPLGEDLETPAETRLEANGSERQNIIQFPKKKLRFR